MFRISKSVTLAAVIAVSTVTSLTPLMAQAEWKWGSSKKNDSNDPNRQAMVEMYQKIQALEEELANLRNQVEVQGNEMKRLQTRLRSVTEDLDRRVQSLESGGKVAGGNTTSAKNAPPATVTDGGDQKAYNAAFSLMKQGDYTRAATSFRRFLQNYPNSPLAGNAQYWIAESSYLVRNYQLALTEFEKVMRNHPNSRKVPDAMLKTGYCQYELKNYSKSRDILTEITQRYSGTQVALSAKSRLALMKKEGH
jgi:tol-pal system protein YbgF